MSDSPPMRRLSTTSSNGNSKREENLINAYEAEEERIINVLSRKLEQLREDKINLENVLEAESESHVNRLSRELTALRLAQQQQQQQQIGGLNGAVNGVAQNGAGTQMFSPPTIPSTPSAEIMLEAMRRENEQLRNRLVDTERDYVRISRLNEIYREELIDHRRRLGLSVDNLIGLSSQDPYSQPTHRRSISNLSSPGTSVVHSQISRTTHGVPIPRPPSQIHRPTNNASETNTPLSHSPSSSESPFLFSPIASTNPASFVSNGTNLTTPPSSGSLSSNPPAPFPATLHTLSYPSVPPPSLSSSFGSPVVSYIPPRDHSLSPVEPLSRRDSSARGGFDRRIPDPATYRTFSRSHSRRGSVDRGARIAETGTLIPRSRASSQSASAVEYFNRTIKYAFNLKSRRVVFFPFTTTMSYQYPYIAGYSSMPTTPRESYQWECASDPSQNHPRHEQQSHHHQAQQQHQQQQQQAQEGYATSPPPTIQLQEQVPIVPSQNPGDREGEPLQLQHYASSSMSLQSSESAGVRPQIHVDTTRHVYAGVSPSSAGGVQGGGPIRTRVSPAHNHVAHPYRRPQSAAGSGPSVRSRREHEPHVRFAGQTAGNPMPAPSRVASHTSSTFSASSSLISPSHRVANPIADNQKFGIRSDLHYDMETGTLTAMCELPGLKKTDLSIVLSTCPYNRVKQVKVSGRSKPPFPEAGYAVKERKFGDFRRTFVVPSDTKPEDVSAQMQDGILTLRISLGPPVEPEGSQEIPIQ
ncbi:hypothetical protein BJ138DRAFT_1135870 [Hygrophoropsis aurantiaca]|uniref:Uncharacterized protein n=1 Tax=Hygrophoropsis aurantiaca TaxID=72124 RepID=A0ACB8AB41_9AGAM|nr:hypothetical protein BJ138DRAFT_1135870 [Hygrophoropsis aurantiaca]